MLFTRGCTVVVYLIIIGIVFYIMIYDRPENKENIFENIPKELVNTRNEIVYQQTIQGKSQITVDDFVPQSVDDLNNSVTLFEIDDSPQEELNLVLKQLLSSLQVHLETESTTCTETLNKLKVLWDKFINLHPESFSPVESAIKNQITLGL